MASNREEKALQAVMNWPVFHFHQLLFPLDGDAGRNGRVYEITNHSPDAVTVEGAVWIALRD